MTNYKLSSWHRNVSLTQTKEESETLPKQLISLSFKQAVGHQNNKLSKWFLKKNTGLWELRGEVSNHSMNNKKNFPKVNL